MTFTHALSTNNYGPAKFIVATSAANGTHTTLASAMTAASVGDTIFLRDSITENVTITPGVNIAAWTGSSANTPSITGKLTMTGAGTSTITGITLITNSDFLLAVTGSAASIINLVNCYLNCLNNTGISFTTSSATAEINLMNCNGDLGTTGIAYFSASTAGTLRIIEGRWNNSGGSSTANTFASSGLLVISYIFNFLSPISISGTSSINLLYCRINSSPTNTTAFTSSSSASSLATYCRFDGGSASAISVSTGTFIIDFCDVDSANTNAITGAGTLQYGIITYTGTSSGNNVTTQTSFVKQSTLKATPFSFNYDITTASGTQNFTSLTFKPIALVDISSSILTTGTTINSYGGNDDGTNHYCTQNVAGTALPGTTNSILIGDTAGGGTRFQTGLVSAFLSNGFTITWTKTGVPTGTAVITGIAIGYQ